ncbi:MAG: tRNA (guanosine(46)-N7)-methyltransferase TrmB [Aquisalimonadaceae bacterium]
MASASSETDYEQTARHRPIRSFVRREGRMTDAQKRALESLHDRYGIPADGGLIDMDRLFGRRAPVILEIGFGNGESLAAMAADHPQRNYIGIEVHRPGVGHLLNRIEALGLENLRVICRDANEVLRQQVPDDSLAGVQLYFPDPWPKKRHHKRRIVQPPWVGRIHGKLARGGFLHMATDWEDYALHMRDVMEAEPGFTNTAGSGKFLDGRGERPETKFERRGLNRGHGVWDLIYTRR